MELCDRRHDGAGVRVGGDECCGNDGDVDVFGGVVGYDCKCFGVCSDGCGGFSFGEFGGGVWFDGGVDVGVGGGFGSGGDGGVYRSDGGE